MTRANIDTYSLLTTVTPPTAGAYLTNATDINAALSTTVPTAYVNLVLPMVDAAIEGYCNRTFGFATYSESIRPTLGQRSAGVLSRIAPLQLQLWPLTTETISVTEYNPADGWSKILTQGTDFEADLPKGQLWRLNSQGNPRAWRAPQIVVQYQAGYVLPGQTTVSGILPLPAEIERAAISLFTDWWRSEGRESVIKQESVAGLSEAQYWVGQLGDGTLPPRVVNLVKKYRVPVVG